MIRYLADVLKFGDLVYVEDNGYEGCHLAIFLGKEGKLVWLIWLDGRKDRCKVFVVDFDRRFKPIVITRFQPEYDDWYKFRIKRKRYVVP